jgi:alanyl-tRNA synthetase
LRKYLRRHTTIKTAEIRSSFVDFFKGKQHKELVSSPVIPFDDPTLLFVNAGMNQFKDVFTGRKKAEYPRAVTVQKCMRAGGKHNDLENVGRTGRHHTFFEMLGNFSFGDYFKEEAIVYAWEWITKHLQLPVDRLYATVYENDDTAFDLWEKIAPELKNGRILRFGKKDNYWSMGDIGPCGPCSEIHFDRGEQFGTGPQDIINGETDRFVEIWNLVFMQYEQAPDGTLSDLPKPSVDTGAGLERIASIMQDVQSNYEIDLFTDLIAHIEEISGKKYDTGSKGVSHRVIADHIRALTFCIADGGGPSNEKQGYVLRRILRRASRHGRILDIKEPFIYRLVSPLANLMGDTYPELKSKQTHIENVIKAEEELFGRTLDSGLEVFNETVSKIKGTGGNFIPGGEVFRLYDTYGFPYDLTCVMAEEIGLDIDQEGFDRMMARQQQQSREAGQAVDGQAEHIQIMLKEILTGQVPQNARTEFIRESFELPAEILEIFELRQTETSLLAVIPDKTPFYVEAGGQTGDLGTIHHENFTLNIEMLYKYNDVVVHVGKLIEKKYTDIEQISDLNINLRLDKSRRQDIMRNHTATHLLHAALRQVLGEHVQQSGSYVGPDKLRFDFSHFKPMTPDEKAEVEKIVNDRILLGSSVDTAVENLEEAKKSGAMAIFGEKYENRVRVVTIDNFSKELCGGTHVDNTSKIGPFMITLETGIASGVRRIEAVTGFEAAQRMLQQKDIVSNLGEITNRSPDDVIPFIRELLGEIKDLRKENKKLKAGKYNNGADSRDECELGILKYRRRDFGSDDIDAIEGWVDSIKGANDPIVCTATGMVNGKSTIIASASGTVGKKIHIGNILKEVVSKFGGRGGGKKNFSRGTYPEGVKPSDIFKEFENKLREII